MKRNAPKTYSVTITAVETKGSVECSMESTPCEVGDIILLLASAIRAVATGFKIPLVTVVATVAKLSGIKTEQKYTFVEMDPTAAAELKKEATKE